MAPPFSENLVYFWQLLSGFRVRHEREFDKLRQHDISHLVDPGKRLQILDLANGRLRPQVIILRNLGHQVTGVDLVNHPATSITDRLYILARRLYQWGGRYDSKLCDNQGLVCSDVSRLPFTSGSFDLVTSIAAFEHFLDVPDVISEIDRVLRPAGIAWICIHLFASLSGGHNVTFTQIPLKRFPKGIDPWDHLRKRRLSFSVPLNEWRLSQYLEAFANHFTIIKHYCCICEGEDLLTPEILAELPEFSSDELTSRTYIILAQKAVAG